MSHEKPYTPPTAGEIVDRSTEVPVRSADKEEPALSETLEAHRAEERRRERQRMATEAVRGLQQLENEAGDTPVGAVSYEGRLFGVEKRAGETVVKIAGVETGGQP